MIGTRSLSGTGSASAGGDIYAENNLLLTSFLEDFQSYCVKTKKPPCGSQGGFLSRR